MTRYNTFVKNYILNAVYINIYIIFNSERVYFNSYLRGFGVLGFWGFGFRV